MAHSSALPNYAEFRVLVLGDVMLDRVIEGVASRISPEAPVPVIRKRTSSERPGGAANVAINLAALGVQTTLIGAVGQDEDGARLRALVQEASIQCELIGFAGLSTNVKTRVVSQGQQLVRIDDEEGQQQRRQAIQPARLEEALSAALDGAQVLILSDYAKGVLQKPAEWIALAKAKGVKVVVDPKRIDLEAYAGADVLTPNGAEFWAAIGPSKAGDDFDQAASDLLQQSAVGALCVTRGEQGVSLYRPQQEPKHVSAQAREVFDVTGAGDTFAAVLGAHLAAGDSLDLAVEMANLAAGLVVAKRGTASVSAAELASCLDPSPASSVSAATILNPAELGAWAERQREQGRRIVMTNGCFDLLHPGHLDCLQQARQLGDLLLVAVNDDASIRALKGPERPLNPLADRLRMLQGLRDVDALVAFAESTPEQLIRRVRPQVLVKGGDYRVEDVAGAEFVLAQGGSVRIIPLLPGYSTTRQLQSIRDRDAVA